MLEYTTQSQLQPPASATQAQLPTSSDTLMFLAPLTPQQKDECISFNVCFRCRQPGHKSFGSTCPNTATWPARAQSPPSASQPRRKTTSSTTTPRLTQQARIDDLAAKLATLSQQFATLQSSQPLPASQPSWTATPIVTTTSPTRAAPQAAVSQSPAASQSQAPLSWTANPAVSRSSITPISTQSRSIDLAPYPRSVSP